MAKTSYHPQFTRYRFIRTPAAGPDVLEGGPEVVAPGVDLVADDPTITGYGVSEVGQVASDEEVDECTGFAVNSSKFHFSYIILHNRLYMEC